MVCFIPLKVEVGLFHFTSLKVTVVLFHTIKTYKGYDFSVHIFLGLVGTLVSDAIIIMWLFPLSRSSLVSNAWW